MAGDICDLKGYRQLVKENLEFKNNAEILNADIHMASTVIEELIKIAQKSILIQCTHFKEDVYSAVVVDLLARAACRGCDVKIATRENVSDEDQRLSFPLFEVRKGLEIFDNDVFIVDGKSYREETDREKRKATVYTYDTKRGNNFYNKFIQKFNLLTP